MSTPTVYHGTDRAFSEFSETMIGRSSGCDTAGFWFTDSKEAAEFYHSGSEVGGRVIEARLVMVNPLRVSSEEFRANWPDGPATWARKARAMGHDGVILSDIEDGDTESTVYAVFSPKQIIS